MGKLNARIYAFPASHDRKLIERMVDVLERTPLAWKRAQYLKTRQATLSKKWRGFGLDDAEVAAAVADLGVGLRKEIAYRRVRRSLLVDPDINSALQRAEDERVARLAEPRPADG